MFNFIKNLFSSTYSTGAVVPLGDSRNIDIASVQAPITLPMAYMSELANWDVKNQGGDPACVGFSFAELSEYIVYKRTGKKIKVDGLKLYKKAKKEDGIPDQGGTYPNVMAKIVTRDGVEDDKGVVHKVSNGYVFVTLYSFELLAQAIYQNGGVASLFIIDTNWFAGIIGKLLQKVGGHEVTLYGYEKSPIPIVKGLNHWGIAWVGRIASMLDRKVTAGHFEAKYEDIKDSLLNILVLTAIPEEIINEVKNTGYKFMNTMKFGSKGPDVKKLQEKLGLTPADGSFGAKTKEAVIKFQKDNNLVADGIVGMGTLKVLNIGSKSFIPMFAKAIQDHEGFYTGSRSFRNNSPANFKTGGRLTAYMQKLGGIGLDKDGFVKFPDYQTGFNALCLFLTDACNGKLLSYKPDMTLVDFFRKYAPSSDNNDPINYAKVVANKIGCSPDVKIGTLV